MGSITPNRCTVLNLLQGVRASLMDELPRILEQRSMRQLKADASYVTTGDLLAQQLILAQVQHFLPEAVMVSEEFRENPFACPPGYTVVVDPIDGTENFASGLPEWGVSVACYHGGKHVASMLGCPELDAWTVTGESMPRRCGSRIRALSSSLTKQDLERILEGHEYRIFGCCVYNMLQVIQGALLSFENPKGANAWDILAGINLALEHGLTVTVNDQPYAGEYLTPDRKYRFQVRN
jgi:myo-inositol-1(or 4)-monophosphatase